MKRQIDPGLNGNNGLTVDEIIGNAETVATERGGFAPSGSMTLQDINNLGKQNDIPFELGDKGPDELVRHHHHHHHHSSGGEHHHSSSGGEHHHSSNGEHHHHSSSNGEHHHHSSSGGEHHHHSSGSGHHHSSHHHHEEEKKKKKRMPVFLRILLAIIAVIVAIAVAVAGVFFYFQQSGKKDVQSAVIDSNEYQETIEYNGHTYKFNEDVVSFAFMGIDQRSLLTSDDTDFVGCADADIVIAINIKSGEIKVIAIPRDTMIDIDMYSESGMFLKTDRAQLCLAYAYGDGGKKSCENVVKGMSRILCNVPIQKYFALDLDGIAPLNDSIGGVTVNSLYDMPEYGIRKGETVTLHGDNAEHYVRTRDMVDINASLNRTDRQVQYVKAFVSQLAPAVMKDFGTVSELYDVAKEYSSTNISLSNVTYLASLVMSKGISDFQSYTIKGEMNPSKPTQYSDVVYAEFTPDEDSLMETVLSVYYTQQD